MELGKKPKYSELAAIFGFDRPSRTSAVRVFIISYFRNVAKIAEKKLKKEDIIKNSRTNALDRITNPSDEEEETKKSTGRRNKGNNGNNSGSNDPISDDFENGRESSPHKNDIETRAY